MLFCAIRNLPAPDSDQLPDVGTEGDGGSIAGLDTTYYRALAAA